uniref:Nodule Cysteine-Rich (NCR) secreted peptide n=1 Tax=Panagrellus redivivus TaxID=6233 RepID=A0A7E4VB45_PANRE
MQLLRILLFVLCFNLLFAKRGKKRANPKNSKEKIKCQMDWECDETFVCEDGFCYELPIYDDTWDGHTCINNHNCPEFFECRKDTRTCVKAILIH